MNVEAQLHRLRAMYFLMKPCPETDNELDIVLAALGMYRLADVPTIVRVTGIPEERVRRAVW